MRFSVSACLLGVLLCATLLATVHAAGSGNLHWRLATRNPGHRADLVAEDAPESSHASQWRAAHGVSGGVLGLDVSQGYNATTFKCLVNHGFSFLVQRLWRSLCVADAAAGASVDEAWRAGFSQVDFYLYPQRNCALSPEEQIRQALAAAKGHKFGKLWFDIETAGSGWSLTDFDANLAWTKAAVAEAVRQLGPSRVGMYTNKHNWEVVMNNRNVTEFAHLPVWYAHYDKDPSFADWQPFGPWHAPVGKQFTGTSSVCGASLDHNWAPKLWG